MSAIKGTWRNGLVTLDEPANWPEGSRVLVERDVADLDKGTDPTSQLSSAEFERLLDELARCMLPCRDSTATKIHVVLEPDLTAKAQGQDHEAFRWRRLPPLPFPLPLFLAAD